MLLTALPLAAFSAVFFWVDTPPADTVPIPAYGDAEQAKFGQCFGPRRITCVVDGDTIWYQGTKIRIADINTPET